MVSKVILVGGSGGIGKDIEPLLSEKYYVISLSSKDINLTSVPSIRECLNSHLPAKALINLSTVSIDSTIHKLDGDNYEGLDKQLSVNIRGSSVLVNEFAKIARENKIGKYIYISSILSESPVPGAGIYSACKAYNDSLVQTAALENAKIPGVTFNSIQLGYFGSGLCERLSPEMKEYALKTIPVKRFGNPKELVDLIELIINNDYITGQNIKLAGGL